MHGLSWLRRLNYGMLAIEWHQKIYVLLWTNNVSVHEIKCAHFSTFFLRIYSVSNVPRVIEGVELSLKKGMRTALLVEKSKVMVKKRSEPRTH
jgi:hypothetical protein